MSKYKVTVFRAVVGIMLLLMGVLDWSDGTHG